MGRLRLIGLLVGVSALLALVAPSSALAGTFNWSLPNDFTTSAPGSNPELKYGSVSWTYEVDGAAFPSSDFSTTALPCGGPGYSDPMGDCVGVASGQMQMVAAAGHGVRIAWTNPFPSTQTVAVNDTISTNAVSCPIGNVVQSPSGTSVTLAPGRNLTITVTGSALPCAAMGGVQVSATTPGPMITLNSPGTTPLHTAAVKLSGTASTGFSDSNQVTVAIYPRTDTSGSPIHQLTGTVGSGGAFAVQTPALADGEYTAVASQGSGAGTGKSPAVTFRIKVHPPALTMDRPPGDAWIARSRLSFSGHAGNALGDASKVTLQLYRGTRAGGTLVGKRDVRAHGASWSTTWPGLHLGYYTAVATQSDDAGHTARIKHTFRLVSKTTAFGSRVTVAGNIATVAIGCRARSNQSCRGSVLIVTKHSYRTAPGGPSGPLEVLFAKVRIPGGTMGVISGRVPGAVLHVLRRMRHVRVTVSSKLSHSGDRSASRVLRVT